MPGQPVPFPYIHGLDPRQQRELYRDFESVVAQITQSTSIFDAVIDSDLAASDPGAHRYVNLTELVANESWTTTLSVGVLQRSDVAISEPAPVSLSGKGNLTLFGIAAPVPFISGNGWDWQLLTVGNTQQVFYYNISFAPTSSQGIQSGGGAFFDNCYFATNVSGLAGGSFRAYNCFVDTSLTISSSGGVQIRVEFYECAISGSLTIGALTEVRYLGGSIGLSGGGTCLVISSTGFGRVAAALGTGNSTISNTGGGEVTVENTGGTPAGGLTVSSTQSAYVRGLFGDVVFSGTSGGVRLFEGGSLSLDITGPMQVTNQNTASNFGRHVILRGTGIRADLHNFAGRLECVGLVDSLVTCDFAATPAYSIDSASTRCLFIFGGARNPSPGTQTNSGTNIRIITEADDTLITNLVNSGALQGPPGEEGPPGADGAEGPPGDRGATGATGATGAAGASGTQGGQGPPGPPGEDGVDGDQGPPGSTGSTGATGATGQSGGAITIPYHFSTTTTDSDPGDGVLRLDNATQNTSLTIRADTKEYPDLAVISAILDTFDDSSSAIKGFIRLVKQSDVTAWLLFAVTGLAAPSGYRNITVVPIASSSASPFANGDNIYLKFDRNGDVGTQGPSGPPGQDGEDGEQGPPGDTNQLPWNTAWGEVAYAQVTANQSAITTIVDLTGLTVTFVATPNRIYEITVGVRVLNSTANIANVVTVADGSNTAKRIFQAVDGSTTSGTDAPFAYREAGLSGSVTRKLRGSTASGAMTLSAAATLPAYIWVKDVGPAPV